MYALIFIITDSVLLFSQCYISLDFTRNSGKKSSVPGHKRKAYISLCTCSHKCRTGPGISKCNDCLQIMQRNSSNFLLVFQNDHIFTIQ